MVIAFLISTGLAAKLSNVQFSVVSSVYKIKENLGPLLIILLIKIWKRKVPMTEPCGAPIDIGLIWKLFQHLSSAFQTVNNRSHNAV